MQKMATNKDKYDRHLDVLQKQVDDANKRFQAGLTKKREMRTIVTSVQTAAGPTDPALLQITKSKLTKHEPVEPVEARKQNNVRKCILVFRPRGSVFYRFTKDNVAVDSAVLALFSIPEIKFTIAQIDDAAPEIYIKGHGDDENNDYGRLSDQSELRSVATNTNLYLYKIDLSQYNLATKTRVRWDAGQSTLMNQVAALKSQLGVGVFEFNYADAVKLCLRLTVKEEDVVQTKARTTNGALPSDPLFAKDLAQFLSAMGIKKKQVVINSCVDEFVVIKDGLAIKDIATHDAILAKLGTYLKDHLAGSEFATRYRIPHVQTASTSCCDGDGGATSCDDQWEDIYPVSTGCYGSGGWHNNSNSKRNYHHHGKK